MSKKNIFQTWPPLSNAELLRRTANKSESAAEPAAQDQGSGENYKVGYKRPPLRSRFQPGVSGNPKGRRKRHLNIKEEIQQVYLRKIGVQDGAKKQHISKIVLLFNRLLNDGLKGDRRSALAAANMAKHFGVYDMKETFEPDFSSMTEDERELCFRAATIMRRIREGK